MADYVYDLKNALPNKLIKSDGTVTDMFGNVVTRCVDAYSIKAALPNKFLNPDGTYSTLNELLGNAIENDIFIVVTELPEIGEENRIYLISNHSNGFDEWYYEEGKWDNIGVMTYTPMTALDDYPSIARDGTTIELFNSIQALNLPVGSILLGICKLTDIDEIAPGMKQEEIKIEVYNNNVLHGTMTSTNVPPYEWSIQYAKSTDFWRSCTTVDVVQNMIDEAITNTLGGEY